MILLKDGRPAGRPTQPPFEGGLARPRFLAPLSRRHPRRSVIVELNPNQILAAEISRPHNGPAVIEAAAEFDADDTVGLGRWIGAAAEDRKAWLPAICGLVSTRGILHRDAVQARQLTDPQFVTSVITLQEEGRSMTSAPFMAAIDPEAWTLRAVNAVDGTTLPDEGPARPALICGASNADLLAAQQRLLDDGLIAERIEPGLLPLFGTIYGCMERNRDARAVVIVVIHAKSTSVYILGKEGVHTPNPVLYGFDSIVELARKELGIDDENVVRRRLRDGDLALVEHASKLLRRIGRDLKPVVDSYEMTTGQPVEEVFCPYLPLGLSWMSGPLARVIGRTAMTIDCEDWLTKARLRPAGDVKGIGPHWLGVLSLAADLPEPASLKSARASGEDLAYQRPWHVNYKQPVDQSDTALVGRGFLSSAIAGGLLLLAAAATAWQLYVTQSLRADTVYWETRMSDNRQLFDELTIANAQLKSQSGVMKNAYELMGAPLVHSDFILNLGRTLPARMRVDRIEANDSQVNVSGVLFEPAEEASESLGHYLEQLRRNRAIGPLFSSIAIKSLNRRTGSDDVAFVITLRLKPARP
ncbi:MAG TPA: hypothetical protein VM029_17130 [Opitutaceae bacterium]|nr:hypothetical protein [Opitutaceae bacterium]